MKTSLTKLKSNLFFLVLALFALPLWAKPVAQVTELKGEVFVISPDGKTKTLMANDHIEDKSEILVGEDGVVTLNDYYDATYHMIYGAHVKFYDKSVQLKKGKTWIQSQNSRHPLTLTTGNGSVNFWKAEFISTFDQASSKSQFLVVNGEVEVSNVLDKNVKYNVTAGTFTVVDPSIENGLPRSPTKVGLSSLNAALAEFKHLPKQIKTVSAETTPAPARDVASVVPETKKGEIIFMTSGSMMGRLPASVAGKAHLYFKKKATKAPIQHLTTAPIRFYGMSQPSQATESERNPASVNPISSPALPLKIGTDLNIDPEFHDSLREQTVKQPKYTNELESLIQDLKSY